jgi:hypothetical protein
MKKKNTEVQSINCEQAIARFNDFMDNYLKGKTREELLKHFAECKGCMERFEFEQLLKSKVHQLSGSPDKAMKEKIEKLIASL